LTQPGVYYHSIVLIGIGQTGNKTAYTNNNSLIIYHDQCHSSALRNSDKYKHCCDEEPNVLKFFFPLEN
jgi:hypothetical protein